MLLLINMNKIKFLLLIFLFCSTFVCPVCALELAEPVEMKPAEKNSFAEQLTENVQLDGDMFAPIDLDLTDYT